MLRLRLQLARRSTIARRTGARNQHNETWSARTRRLASFDPPQGPLLYEPPRAPSSEDFLAVDADPVAPIFPATTGVGTKRMRRGVRPVAGLSLLCVLFVLALSCRQDVPSLFQINQPPETILTVIPEDSTRAFYRYHVYWHGEDADGHVVRYLFAITDSLSHNELDN